MAKVGNAIENSVCGAASGGGLEGSFNYVMVVLTSLTGMLSWPGSHLSCCAYWPGVTPIICLKRWVKWL